VCNSYSLVKDYEVLIKYLQKCVDNMLLSIYEYYFDSSTIYEFYCLGITLAVSLIASQWCVLYLIDTYSNGVHTFATATVTVSNGQKVLD